MAASILTSEAKVKVINAKLAFRNLNHAHHNYQVGPYFFIPTAVATLKACKQRFSGMGNSIVASLLTSKVRGI